MRSPEIPITVLDLVIEAERLEFVAGLSELVADQPVVAAGEELCPDAVEVGAQPPKAALPSSGSVHVVPMRMREQEVGECVRLTTETPESPEDVVEPASCSAVDHHLAAVELEEVNVRVFLRGDCLYGASPAAASDAPHPGHDLGRARHPRQEDI
jgi:hypothetical protein